MIQHPRGQIDMALTELQRMGQHASQTLQSYIKFSAKMSIDTWPTQNDQVLQYIKSEVDAWINKDAYFPSKKRQFQASKLDVSTIPPYSLFSKQPLLCGLLLFRLNMLLQDTGVALAHCPLSYTSTMPSSMSHPIRSFRYGKIWRPSLISMARIVFS